MNGRHRRTLEAVLRDPAPASLAWRDIEALFVALGCKVKEGSGSRVRFEAGGIVGAFHRPHPRKEAKPYQVLAARDFLERRGVVP